MTIGLFHYYYHFFLKYFSLYLQGGLIGLAAATVGLATEASQHLEVSIVLKPLQYIRIY